MNNTLIGTNSVTKQIESFCAVDKAEAWAIYLRMIERGCDFSEISGSELRRAIIAADAELIREKSRV